MHKLSINTSSSCALIDITAKLEQVVAKDKARQGICVVFVPHTTAAVTINENADPTVRRDILKEIDKIVPLDDDYSHSEGNSAAHIKASLMGSSLSIIIEDGRLCLGTWQGVYFCEFDGPRKREIWVKIIPGG